MTVYRDARRFASSVERLARRVPEFRRDLRDQMRRSSASIVQNIAEGAGEFRRPEKARFYRMARRSAAETAATLDLVADLPESVEGIHDLRDELIDVAAALTSLIHAMERRG